MEGRVWYTWCALIFSVCCVPAASAQTRAAAWNDVVLMVTAEPRKDAADIGLLRSMSAELMTISPTFRQMLEALKTATHMNLRARPVGGRRALGRGHFTVAGTFTMGLMEISVFRRDSHLQVRAIAHELAHATEIACLPPQADTATLHQRLVGRAGREGVLKGHGIETPFALAAERIVLREYMGHGLPEGQLPYLATTYDLPLCLDGVSSAPPLHAELSQAVR